MDCIVHGVAKSQTQLSDFHFPKGLCVCENESFSAVSVMDYVCVHFLTTQFTSKPYPPTDHIRKRGL